MSMTAKIAPGLTGKLWRAAVQLGSRARVWTDGGGGGGVAIADGAAEVSLPPRSN